MSLHTCLHYCGSGVGRHTPMRGATKTFFVPREGWSSRYRGHVGGDHDNVVSCIDVDWISMRAVSGHGGSELAAGLAEEQALTLNPHKNAEALADFSIELLVDCLVRSGGNVEWSGNRNG